MPYNAEAVSNAGYVRLELIGEITRQELEVARANAGETLKQNGWKRLLIDATNATPKMSVVDDFEFTQEHNTHLPVNLRTAIVHSPGEVDQFQFIEDVGRNRGMDMTLFDDQMEALHWLLEEAT